MRKEINRREFLKGAGIWVAGIALGGCTKRKEDPAITEQPTVKPTATPTIETPTVTTKESIKVETPTMTVTPEVNKIVIEGIILTNVPKEVDSNIVDVAKGEFENKTGVAPHIFADPGGLLVGPDFGYEGKENPWGNNPGGWKTMYESEGSIQGISPVNQEVIRWAGEAYQNLPEGGFILFSGGQMTVELGKINIKMLDKGLGHNYFFAARGLYPDGRQDTDRNIQVKITDYIPGHIEINEYQSKKGTNLAFISEEQLLQKVTTSHSSGTNCGAEGCSTLTIVALDVNTGALEIYNHRQEESNSLEKALAKAEEGWQLVYSNYREVEK